MDLILQGAAIAFTPTNFFYCLIGVSLGTAIGVLPGIGALSAVSMLLPVSFYLEPTTALILLAGVYYGAEYGGSTASILLNLPGTPSSAVACIEGYPMSKSGRSGVALFITAIASFVGGSIGIVILMVMTPIVVAGALLFSAAEYFAAMIFALVLICTISQRSVLRALASVMVGLLLGAVGTDVITGAPRFTLGYSELLDGVNIVIIAMGIFGIAEVAASVDSNVHQRVPTRVTLRSMLPTREDSRRSAMPILRGTAIGSIVGVIPGIGGAFASFMSYAAEKRISKRPQDFGKGAIEGLAAPEASNNAAAQTSFIPTLALGIPGSATMAIMIGALMIHGINPGPRLVLEHPDLFWGVVMSFWIGNVMLLIINIPLIGVWVSLLSIPYHYLYPAIISLICIGIYSIGTEVFDLWLLLGMGLIGYVLRLLGFEAVPLLIGFVLGPLLEENFRRAMILSFGELTELVMRPISGTLLLGSLVMLALIAWPRKRSLPEVILEKTLSIFGSKTSTPEEKR